MKKYIPLHRMQYDCFQPILDGEFSQYFNYNINSPKHLLSLKIWDKVQDIGSELEFHVQESLK